MAISNNSTGLRTGVCTSASRPTAPYEGQHIYETDTDIEYVWNGTAWVVNYVSAASPAFTGTPTAPTATGGTNTTQLATTAFVTTADNLKANLSGATFTGNILQPNRPMFYAIGATGSYTSGTLPYDTATTNIGSHYNTTTRTFTAPIAGAYLFTTQHWAEPSAAGAIYLTVAGRSAVVGRETAQTGYEGYCGSQVAYMTAGQTATTSVYQGSVHLNSSLSYFSGVFLG